MHSFLPREKEGGMVIVIDLVGLLCFFPTLVKEKKANATTLLEINALISVTVFHGFSWLDEDGIFHCPGSTSTVLSSYSYNHAFKCICALLDKQMEFIKGIRL